MEILGEQEISTIEAKRILDDRKKAGELVYEQKICSEYLDKVTKELDCSDAEMKKELMSITILRPRHVSLIVNNLPDSEEEVQALFSREIVNLKKDEMKQIVDIVNNHRKK